MKKTLAVLISLFLMGTFCAAEEEGVTFGDLIVDLVIAGEAPSDEALSRIDADLADLDDPVASAVAEHWKKVWLDPDYRLYLYGEDDPALLPIGDRHAFVVLGYALKNGEMQEELIGRCAAAAAAARAFPDSILVCTGGPTGANNPDKHTEGGMMRDHLIDVWGIAPGRIFTEEQALTTAQNARNTLEILMEQGIETLTVVTSDYHQLWGQTLYNAMDARAFKDHGYRLEIIGNYCWYTGRAEGYRESAMEITASQLASVLELPNEQVHTVRTMGRPEE